MSSAKNDRAMKRRDRGFLHKLRDCIPISRAAARRLVHKELIDAARTQVAKGVMEGTVHALTKKDAPIPEPEKIWWKSQSVRWETIWRMLNETSTDLQDFKKLSDLGRLGDVCFKLYEQMAVDAVTSFCEVPPITLREEALKWRTLGSLISGLHRHCLMGKLYEMPKTGKKTPVSGIKEMGER